MNKILKIVLSANVILIALLVFIYPHLMVAPGKLIVGHEQLTTDCFACHAPLKGAASERCIVCHKPVEIGRLTTRGQLITQPQSPIPFHQKLISQDCVACHSDHAGVQRFQSEHFKHDLLPKTLRDVCQDCHRSPNDSLHQQLAGNCRQCHTQEKWRPTSFDHAKYFVLDGDHNTRCVTCHVGNDYSRYTCYGCHEHTPANIRSEHAEEGIGNVEHCVACHRSANEHEIRGRGRNGEDEERTDD
ncbi:MAG: class III cytochrome C family protein [Methylococcaceae bacterium]|nr:class III cytochrome C family protein [Methylococcaceae bacterium]